MEQGVELAAIVLIGANSSINIGIALGLLELQLFSLCISCSSRQCTLMEEEL